MIEKKTENADAVRVSKEGSFRKSDIGVEPQLRGSLCCG